MTQKPSVAGCLGMFLYVAFTAVPSACLYGWTFSKMWSWFVEHQFGLPHLGIAASIGLATLVKLATYQSQVRLAKDPEGKGWIALIIPTLETLILCGSVLSIGWIAKQFM